MSAGLPLEVEEVDLVGKGAQWERKVKESEAPPAFPTPSSATDLGVAAFSGRHRVAHAPLTV